MKEVNVKKEELLQRLRENGLKHLEEYRTAIEGWRRKAIEELQVRIDQLNELNLAEAEDLKRDDFPNLWIDSAQDRPECHCRDYDRAIAMLEMSTDDVVTITAREFDQFVNDEWDWKEAFTVSNAKYGL